MVRTFIQYFNFHLDNRMDGSLLYMETGTGDSKLSTPGLFWLSFAVELAS